MTSGLIDDVLDLRKAPATPDDFMRFMESEDFHMGYQAAVDDALSILVPAMKKIALLPSEGGANSLPKDQIGRIIGHVPIKRTAMGWE